MDTIAIRYQFCDGAIMYLELRPQSSVCHDPTPYVDPVLGPRQSALVSARILSWDRLGRSVCRWCRSVVGPVDPVGIGASSGHKSSPALTGLGHERGTSSCRSPSPFIAGDTGVESLKIEHYPADQDINYITTLEQFGRGSTSSPNP